MNQHVLPVDNSSKMTIFWAFLGHLPLRPPLSRRGYEASAGAGLEQLLRLEWRDFSAKDCGGVTMKNWN